jgi:hypothetical protein
MSLSQTNGAVAITGGDRPLVAPDAICEGCDARGTVGRAGSGAAASRTHGGAPFLRRLLARAVRILVALDVVTVQQLGWAGMKNGVLLRAARNRSRSADRCR